MVVVDGAGSGGRAIGRSAPYVRQHGRHPKEHQRGDDAGRDQDFISKKRFQVLLLHLFHIKFLVMPPLVKISTANFHRTPKSPVSGHPGMELLGQFPALFPSPPGPGVP